MRVVRSVRLSFVFGVIIYLGLFCAIVCAHETFINICLLCAYTC